MFKKMQHFLHVYYGWFNATIAFLSLNSGAAAGFLGGSYTFLGKYLFYMYTALFGTCAFPDRDKKKTKKKQNSFEQNV